MSTSKVRSAVASNPATTTSLVGALVVAVCASVGLDDATTARVAAVAIAAVPIVRGIVAWYQARRAA